MNSLPPLDYSVASFRNSNSASRLYWRGITFLLGAWLVAACVGSSRAEITSPLWGVSPPLNIHGVDYDWSNASEVNGIRIDEYTSGNGDGFQISGAVDAPVGVVFGVLASSETIRGFLSNGQFVEEVYSENGDGTQVTTPESGKTYQQTESRTYWSLDSSGNLQSEIVKKYDSIGGSPATSFTVNSAGVIAGDEHGFFNQSYLTWYINYSSGGDTQNPSISPPSPLFANSYSCTSFTYVLTYTDATGYYQAADTLQFGAANGASCTITATRSGVTNFTPTISSASLSGNDPAVGQFSADYVEGSFVIDPTRSGPSFTPRRLWSQDTVLCWKSGYLDYTGNTAIVTDLYRDHQNTMSVTITGDLMASYAAGGNYVADVLVVDPAGITHAASYNCQTQHFTDYELQLQTGRRTTPALSSATIWVNGSAFAFESGFSSNNGDLSDTYRNGSLGTLILDQHNSLGDGQIYLSLTFNNDVYSGTSDGTNFTITSGHPLEILTSSPNVGNLPPKFWIDGWFFYRISATSGYYDGGGAGGLIVSGTPGNFSLFGGDGTTTFSASYAGTPGVFTLSYSDDSQRFGYPASDDYVPQIGADLPDEDRPPAISLQESAPWLYLGKTGDLYCYGDSRAVDSGGDLTAKAKFLTISTGPTGTVNIVNKITGEVKTGFYIQSARLFQSSTAPTDLPLPMPVYGVDPDQNFQMWRIDPPSGNLPGVVFIGYAVWRFGGFDSNGRATYLGYYPGQILTITPSTRGGSAVVALTDPYDTDATGVYYNQQFTLTNNVQATPGSVNEVPWEPTGPAKGLHTTDGDLDITGNLLSLGSWQNDPTRAGLTLEYSEQLTQPQATWHSLISLTGSRRYTSWLWSHATSDGNSTQPAMLLSAIEHALQLFDPSDSATPKIVLDPGHESRIGGDLKVDGVLRIPHPAGDIKMFGSP